MPKKTTKTILALLKKQGVDLGDDLEKVTEALDDVELSAEEFLSSDQIILTKSEHRELKDDLTKLRDRMKTAEGESKDLRDAMDSGDSDNVRKATQYKKKIDELEPLVKTLLDQHRGDWKASAEKIPEKLKTEFSFAEKDKELTTPQLLANVKKYAEYVRIGLIEGTVGDDSDGKPDDTKPADQPRVGPKQPRKLTKEQIDELTPGEKMEHGYKPREPEGTAT